MAEISFYTHYFDGSQSRREADLTFDGILSRIREFISRNGIMVIYPGTRGLLSNELPDLTELGAGIFVSQSFVELMPSRLSIKLGPSAFRARNYQFFWLSRISDIELKIASNNASGDRPSQEHAGIGDSEERAGIQDVLLSSIEFSVRTSNVLLNQNIMFLSELIEYKPEELLEIQNFGRKSLRELEDFLSQCGTYLGDTASSFQPFEANAAQANEAHHLGYKVDPMSSSFEQFWGAVTKSLNEREKEILDLRFGVSTPNALVLEELGRKFNVTRERIRQIEKKAIIKAARRANGRELDKFLTEEISQSVYPVSAESLAKKIYFFSEVEKRPSTFSRTLRDLLGLQISIVRWRSDLYFARIDQTELDLIYAQARDHLRASIGKPWADYRNEVGLLLSSRASEFAEEILAQVRQTVALADGDSGPVILHASSNNRISKAAHIAQIVSAAESALDRSEIAEKTGLGPEQIRGALNVLSRDCKNYGIYQVRHGSWWHIDKIGITKEKSEMIEQASSVISAEVRGEQFHSREVLKVLGNGADHLDEFHISAALRHFTDFRYLGRNVFAVPGSKAETREKIHDHIVNTLMRENRAMHRSEILEEVNKLRSVNLDMAIHSKEPLVSLGGDQWGLDVDGFGE